MIRDLFRIMSGRQRAAAAALAAILTGAALLETAVFVLLAPLAQAVTVGDTDVAQELGPLSIDLSVGRTAALLGAFVVLMTAARLISVALQARLVISLERTERRKVFDGYLGASWELQSQEPPGRIQAVVGFASARAGIVGITTDVARAGVNLAVMLVAAFVVSPAGALAMIVLGGILYLGFRPLVAAAKRQSGVRVRRTKQHNENLGELVAVAGESRVFGAAEGFRRRLVESDEGFLQAKRRSMVLSGTITPVYQAIGLTVAVSILGYAAARESDVVAFGTVALLMIRSVSYGQALQTASHRLAEAAPAIDSSLEWQDTFSREAIVHGSAPLGRVESIQLRDISYRYGDDEPALQDVSLEVRGGEQVGLVGPSGSGKSTLVQLVLGLRAPTAGEVLINGLAPLSYAESMLRSQISLVPQRTTLFTGTIAENIRFFRSGIDDEAIEVAARRAGLLTTIEALPDGFATEVGTGVRELSGGQLQRLGIARSLAGDPSLIVFDEPTSALDADAEQVVTETLHQLQGSVTVILVAHRFSTLRHCNRVVVMENGSISAVGDPDAVMDGNAFFRRASEQGGSLE